MAEKEITINDVEKAFGKATSAEGLGELEAAIAAYKKANPAKKTVIGSLDARYAEQVKRLKRKTEPKQPKPEGPHTETGFNPLTLGPEASASRDVPTTTTGSVPTRKPYIPSNVPESGSGSSVEQRGESAKGVKHVAAPPHASARGADVTAMQSLVLAQNYNEQLQKSVKHVDTLLGIIHKYASNSALTKADVKQLVSINEYYTSPQKSARADTFGKIVASE